MPTRSNRRLPFPGVEKGAEALAVAESLGRGWNGLREEELGGARAHVLQRRAARPSGSKGISPGAGPGSLTLR